MYKLFVDDSGTKEYRNLYSIETSNSLPVWGDSKNNRDFLEHNFFVLCGLHIRNEDMKSIDDRVKQLKISTFGTEHIEIKSCFLRNPIYRNKHYLIPYNINIDTLRLFSEQLHVIISENNDKIKIISTVFDKRRYRYRDKAENNPLYKSTQILFERVQYTGKKTKIVFDQMESNLSKNKGKHKKILNIHKSNDGMTKIFIDEYTNIEDIEFQQSKNENFLQLADICAYNIRRQFMEHGKIWIEGPSTTICPTYDYFDKIRDNFHHKRRKVVGCGLVLIPDFHKISWNVLN